MTRFALLALLLLLAGCNVHRNDRAEGDDNVTVRADGSGNISFDVPFAKGQVKVPSGFMHGSDVDIDGVKLMPGSQVTGFSLDSRNKVSNVVMSFTAPQSPDQVRAYFVDQFRKKGVDASVSGDTVTGKSRDGNPFTIQVSASGSGSQGTIHAQDNDKD